MAHRWTCQSTLILTDPPAYASAFLLERILSRGRSVDVVYCGDRMWPALSHGQTCRLEPAAPGSVRRGAIVLVCPNGIPDLLRIVSIRDDDVLLCGDADDSPPRLVAKDKILGRVDGGGRAASSAARKLRRFWLDLREAITRGPDRGEAPEGTVRFKYEVQAPFYRGRTEMPMLSERLMKLIEKLVPAGGSVLVGGSGAGHECFQLARAGYRPSGIDFAPSMVAIAREEAGKRGLEIPFHQADLRTCEVPSGTLDAVLFTYDVYSFISVRSDRVAVLSKMRRWLKPGGVIFLSARICYSSYERFIQTVQWITSNRGSRGRWGDSHTRWIASDGRMHRSYLRIFTRRSLDEEIRAAGLRAGLREGGHIVIRTREGIRSSGAARRSPDP